MAYLWQLAHRYADASGYSAITHPSLPNYLAIFTESAFNDPPDCSPGPGCSYPGPPGFGQALTRGKTAAPSRSSAGLAHLALGAREWVICVHDRDTLTGSLRAQIRQGDLFLPTRSPHHRGSHPA